jgi:hypothetical protein
MTCYADKHHLYDSVSEAHFGPECRDDDEATALICHIARTRALDPRIVPEGALVKFLEELRTGHADAIPTHPAMLCACGSGKQFRRLMWHMRKTFSSCEACNPSGGEVWTESTRELGTMRRSAREEARKL